MMRAFSLLVLIYAALAQPSSAYGGTISPDLCPYHGPATNLSCINPAETTHYLVNGANHSAQYELTPQSGVCGGASKNCLNIYQARRPIGRPWSQIGYTTKAILCANQVTPAPGSYFNFDQPAFGMDSWWQSYDTGGGLTMYQVAVPCSTGPVAMFVNKMTTKNYYNLETLCRSAFDGNSLEAKAAPPGIPFWRGGCSLTVPNVTLTLDAGVKVYQPSCDNGAGGICLNAARQTLTGAGATIGYQSVANINEVVDIHADLGKNTNIEGAKGNYLTVDCQGLYGQAIPGSAPTGILSGRSVGTVRLAHVRVQNCGAEASGQHHAIYLGWGPSAPADDPSYCEDFSDVVVRDAGGDTSAIKLDDTCSNSRGAITNLSVYCTIEGHPNNNCDENEPIDFQCGGWHFVQNSYFEMYGQPGSNDQIFFTKVNWGALGRSGCQTTDPRINNVRFDRDIFVFDGHANYSSAFGRRLVVACGSAKDGDDCNANAKGHVAICITNSQIIEDDYNYSASNSLWAGPGVYTDANCRGVASDTNTYYAGQTGTASAGRTSACLAPNWSKGGSTKCAFPFVPQFLEASVSHDTLVAAAHSAGFCGKGTMGDPIRACSAAALE